MQYDGGASPVPSATMALTADHDGQPDSYGLELSIDELESVPDDEIDGNEPSVALVFSPALPAWD